MNCHVKFWSLIALLLAACAGWGQPPGVVINEILASNSQNATDAQGEHDDWIELYNGSDVAIDVGGMYLTDDLANPTKWQIPAGTTVAARGYLLIWADADVQDEGLHTNFQLQADGEEIALFDVDGTTLLDSVAFEKQTTDISFGRYPDGTGEFRLMGEPTPGAANVAVYEGFVAPVEFSHERGFYETPFELTLSCDTPDAVIYYTVDGSAPFSEIRRIPAGTVYTGPILVYGTTTLRVQAFRTGWRASQASTTTYIFLDDVIQQGPYPSNFPRDWGSTRVDYGMDPEVVQDPAYAPTLKEDLKTIPSVSVVIDNDDFFGSARGIYANLSGHGTNWERPASIEWIDPVEGDTFQVDVGLRVHGSVYGRTSSVAKHSLRLLFKNEYGPSRLKYPLFGDTDVEDFESLVLRSIWNYSWFGDSTACGGLGTDHADYLRDQYARDTVRDMGGLTPHSRPVHAYVNGLYWGLFIFVERPDDGFCAQHLGGEKPDYDVLIGNSQMEVMAGDLEAWNTLMALAREDLSRASAYQAMHEQVDVPAMIDYLLMIYYTGSRDAPVLLCNDSVPRNFYAIRRREPAGPFIFVPWDVEWILESPNVNRVRIVGQSNPHYLLDRLMSNPDFRVLLADHIYERFFHGGALTPESAIDRYMSRADEIDRAIVGESARWGDSRRSRPYTRDVEWVAERDRLVNEYFSVRTDIVLGQLRQAGFYPSVAPPDYYVNGQFQRGGPIESDDAVSLNANGGDIWYTVDGSDPRLPGSRGGSGQEWTLIAEDATKRVLVPTGPVDEAWRADLAFDDSDWISGAGGVGYEGSTGYEPYFDIDLRNQMYGRNAGCYIRIPFDMSAEQLEGIGGLTLNARYDDGFIVYLNGVEVQRVMFDGDASWDAQANDNHSDLDAIDFEPFNLSGHIEQLRVGPNLLAIHGLNASATSSDFLISVEVMASEGAGDEVLGGVAPTAIRYVDPVTFDGSVHIKSRLLSGTTWSALNETTFAVGPVAESLRISELMYRPAGDPNAEYIELTNIGAETINLNLVRFSNGVDFTFPSLELAPGQYVVVVRDVTAFENAYAAGLNVAGQYAGSLNNGGERLVLEDAAGQAIHDFGFSDGWYDLTDGLDFSLTIRDAAAPDITAWDSKRGWRPSAQAGGSPGYDDTDDIVTIGAVVINELLANSQAATSDWIELYNTTAQAIDISGWFLSDDGEHLTKYEFPAGTVIAADGYLVVYADETFDDPDAAGSHETFALSRQGETLYLHSGSGGVLTGYSEQEKFDASAAGVSLGRYRKSTGSYNFVALTEPTPGGANAAPVVGPVVISEIMYNPSAVAEAEYVELVNIGAAPVTLYDALLGLPWRFTDDPDDPGIDLLLPMDSPVTLAPGECLVLTQNAIALRTAYAVSAGVVVLEWGGGKLSNGGDKVQLSRPGAGAESDDDHWLRVDRVVYSDGSHGDDFAGGVDPWPTAADGAGAALTRIDATAYGNDPANWIAADPSPGRPPE